MKGRLSILIPLIALALSCSAPEGSVRPDEGAFTVKGKVSDAVTGRALAGVVVSDGYSCTRTDRRGRYRIQSVSGVSRNVFVETPSEYEIPFATNGIFNGYSRLDSCSKTNRCDFALSPRKGAVDKCTVLMMGDPQVMTVRPHSVEAWDWTTARLAEYAGTVEGELYQIMLGDMVINEIEVEGKAKAYFDVLSRTGIRTLHVPGNHDHVQSAATYGKAIEKYSEYFGPYNYALNIGKFHFIFFDTILLNEEGKREEGISDEVLHFIGEDLGFVPEDTHLMLCTHCPITRTCGGRYPEDVRNYDRLMELLKGRSVDFWYGHVHFNSSYVYTQEELDAYAPGVKYLGSHIVERPCGNWACSGEVGRDGSPRGMLVMDLDGDSCSWRFKSLDPDWPDDFNIISPGRFKGEGIADDKAVYCNVYFWDNTWGLPQLWIDGKHFCDMELCTSENYPSVADPIYSHFFPIWEKRGITGFRKAEYPREYDNNHLFKATPPAGTGKVEVRFRDGWGREYCRAAEIH